MAGTIHILAMGGDGVGPEVLTSALKVLDVMATKAGMTVVIEEDLLGGAAWDAYGTFVRDETVEAAKAADAVFVGAVGGPKWDGIRVPGGPEMQDGLMRLRKELDTFAGLRPAVMHPSLEHLLPYRPELVRGADVMVLREMCGGAFFAEPRGIGPGEDGIRRGFDTTLYTEPEIARIARAGFELARRRRAKLLSVDKSNVMESGAFWREIVGRIGMEEYPDVALTHFFTDNASYQLARQPTAFDVILGDNLFGDILSDQAGAISGSLGMLPSACLPDLPRLGRPVKGGLYEPVHGSAPDIAGQGIANPIGAILTVAMLFDYGIARPDIARAIERAVAHALADGYGTVDIGGRSSTLETTDAVLRALTL